VTARLAEPFSVESPVLGEAIHGYVVEPDGEPSGLFYLLHGRGGSAGDWLPALARVDVPLVAVLPDAPWSERASWYVDSEAADGRPVERALVADLIPALDARFPGLAHRERRFVGGVSMGGAGALRLALAYPELFGALLALSPAIYVPPPPARSTLRAHGAFGRGDARFDLPIYRALHYRRLLERAPELRAFVAAGDTGDLTDEAAIVAADLVGAGAAVELRGYPGGHGWDVWTPALADGVRALVTRPDART
jgi:enterochelin esterase-like enzyme